MSDLVHIEFETHGSARKRRKRRKPFPWMRIGLLVLLVVVVARWSLSLWFPPALDRWGARYGVSLAYDSMDLSLLGGQVTLRGLRIDDRAAQHAALAGESDPSAPASRLASLDYAVLDVSIGKLLRGHLRVRRAEVDGGRVHWERGADGTWNWEPWVQRWRTDDAPWWTSTGQGQWNTLRVQDLTVLVRDEAQSPVLETQGELDLSLSDLGYTDRPLQFEVGVRAPGWVQGFHASGTSQVQSTGWNTRLQVDVYGLQRDLARRLLEPLGWTTTATDHGLRLSAQLQGQRQGSSASADSNEVESAADSWQGQLQVDSLALQCDHTSALIVDSLRAPLESWQDGAWRFGTVQVSGARVNLQRSADGIVGLGPLQPLAKRTPPNVQAWHCAALEANDLQVAWQDNAVTPHVRLETSMSGNLRSLHWQADRGWQPMQVDLRGEAPDWVARWEAAGEITPQPSWAWSCDWNLEGANGLALEPYAAALGWEWADQDIHLRGHGSGTRRAGEDGARWDLEWRDLLCQTAAGDARFGRLALADWRREGAGWRAAALHVEQGQAWLERDALGRWTTPWGWRTLAPQTPGAGPHSTWGLDEVHLSALDLTWRDAPAGAAPSEHPLQITTAFARDLQPVASGPIKLQSPEWQATGSWPGVAEDLQVGGAWTAQEGRIEWQGHCEIRGWQTNPWEEPIATAGWESDWLGSDFSFRTSGTAFAHEGGWRGDASVQDLQWRQGDHPWLSLQSARAEDWRWSDGSWSVRAAQCVAPRFAIERDAQGVWHGLGMRSVASEAAPSVSLRETWPRLWAQLVSIESLDWSVQDARIPFRDGTRSTASVSDLALSASLRRTSNDPEPSTWRAAVEAHWGSAVETLRAQGEWTHTPDEVHWQATVQAEGLAPGDWSTYWPGAADGKAPEVLWQDGRLESELAGTWRRLDTAAGSSDHPSDVEEREEWTLQSPRSVLTDGGAALPWLAFHDLDLRWSRATVDDRPMWRLEQSRVADLRGSWTREASGETRWLGLRWPAPTTDQDGPVASAGAAPLEASAAKSSESPVAGAFAAEPGAATTLETWLSRLDAWSLAGGSFGPSDWSITDFRWRDETRPEEPEWQLAGRWQSDETWRWGASQEPTPLRGTLRASLSPAFETGTWQIEARPFAADPELRVLWELKGLSGSAFRHRWPAEAQVVPLELAGASSAGQLHARWHWPAQQPSWRGAWQHGFGLEWTALGLRLEESALTEPLVEIGHFEGVATKLHPRARSWDIQRIDVRDARVRTRQEAAGIEAFGLLWAPDLLQRAVSAWTQTEPQGALAGSTTVREAMPAPGGQIQRMQGSRIDWTHTLRTSEPHAVFPVRNGELEILRLAWGSQRSARPMRLFAAADAGPVRVPMREDALTPSAAANGGQTLETRPAWDRLEARGRITALGDPEGWVQLDVSGMELAPWRGWFARHGLELHDGRLDMRNTLRFRGAAGLAVDSRSTLDHLAVVPARDSRIERELRLSRDWSTTLLSLRDGAGHTQVPLRYELSRAAMGWSGLGRGWKEAFADLAQAPASSIRAMEAQAPQQAPELRLTFEPGGPRLTADALAQLRTWVAAADRPQQLHVSHVLGMQDWQQIQNLGSPAAEPLLELLQRLRRRKADLAQRYAQESAIARGLLQYGSQTEAQAAREKLWELDLARAQTEEAIDQVLDRLAPGAERQSTRRARAVALDLAQQRHATLLQELRRLGWDFSEADISLEAPLPRTAPAAGPSTFELRLGPSPSGQR